MAFPRRFVLTVFAAASLAGAFATGSATAATELGDTCIASTTLTGTAVQTGLAPGAPVTYAAPGDGVITQWGTNFPAVPGYSGKLVVLRATGAPNAFAIQAVSDLNAFTPGITQFPARIPVKAGDQIGLTSTPNTVLCSTTNAADTVRYDAAATNPIVGATITASSGPTANARVAVHATLEADADNDGFGDETQDFCPISQAVQTPCPTIKLSKIVLPPAKSSIQLLIGSAFSAPVTVSGSVSVASAKAKKSSAAATFKVGPVTKTVGPGEIGSFKIKFSKKLIAALKAQPKSKKFKLKLTITGKGVANTDTQKATVTLRGAK